MKRTLQAAVLLAAMFIPQAAWASPVTLTAEFTSFTSWMFDPAIRTNHVNGIALTSSGTVVDEPFPGFYYYQSNTVTLPAGTTTVSFGYDPDTSVTPPFTFIENVFSFTPATGQNVNVGDTFHLGDFQFTNGQWYYQADLGFTITTHSTDVALDNHSFTGTIRLISNSTDGIDPETEADFFYFLERPDLGSCRVYDLYSQPASNPGNVGVCAFNGKIGSLIPTSLVATSDAAFTTPSTLPGALNGGAAPVPEPGTLVLLGTGAATLLARRRAQRAARRAAQAR